MTDQVDITIEQLDPRTLLIDANVRLDARLDKPFVQSIKDHGVLQPIVAIRADDGVRVRYGQRRTLGAIEAGRDTVPVVVVTGADDDQVERVITQYAENEHRVGLTTAEQIGVFRQLAAFGLSPTQIARRTKAAKAAVDQALAAGGSDLALAAAARYEFLTLDQAATLAELDDDPETVKALVAAAKTGQFDHIAQRARDERAAAQRLAAFTAELAATGVTVIDQPSYGDTTRRLTSLRDADGQPLTPESHADCPGHAAYVTITWGWIDRASGQPAQPSNDEGEDLTDDDGDDFGDEPEEDDKLTWGQHLTAVYVCTDPTGNGHQDTRSSAGPTTGRPAGPLSEQEKAQRRQVIDNNKAWRSAETVRRTWLRTFLTRKTAPKGAATFTADCLASGDHALRRAMESGHPLAGDLLGLDAKAAGFRAAAKQIREQLAHATEARAAVISLAVLLAAYEAATDVQSWRRTDEATARYLRFLADNGYTLSDVEQLAAGSATDAAAA